MLFVSSQWLHLQIEIFSQRRSYMHQTFGSTLLPRGPPRSPQTLSQLSASRRPCTPRLQPEASGKTHRIAWPATLQDGPRESGLRTGRAPWHPSPGTRTQLPTTVKPELQPAFRPKLTESFLRPELSIPRVFFLQESRGLVLTCDPGEGAATDA